MRESVVWFYQEIARRIGPERMRRQLALLKYGNGKTGGGIDRFWLDGALRISPSEQVDFLDRFARGELPVKPRNTEIVRRILPRAEADGVTLRWKTGLTRQGPLNVGWTVGFVERDATSHVFANLVLSKRTEDEDMARAFASRKELALQLLARFGAIPSTMPPPS